MNDVPSKGHSSKVAGVSVTFWKNSLGAVGFEPMTSSLESALLPTRV